MDFACNQRQVAGTVAGAVVDIDSLLGTIDPDDVVADIDWSRMIVETDELYGESASLR